MEQNPYQPLHISDSRASAMAAVQSPATALFIVAWICIVMSVLAVIVDVLMLASGFAAKLGEVRGNDKEAAVVIRMIWTLVIMGASGFVAFGAKKMQRLESYGVAFASAVVAAVPCVGPCCLLGIPFGIWAIVVLNRADVRSAFRS